VEREALFKSAPPKAFWRHFLQDSQIAPIVVGIVSPGMVAITRFSSTFPNNLVLTTRGWCVVAPPLVAQSPPLASAPTPRAGHPPGKPPPACCAGTWPSTQVIITGSGCWPIGLHCHHEPHCPPPPAGGHSASTALPPGWWVVHAAKVPVGCNAGLLLPQGRYMVCDEGNIKNYEDITILTWAS